jgi:hypothetical protein
MNWAAVVGLFHFVLRQRNVWSGYPKVVSLPKATALQGLADQRDSKVSA